MDVTALIRPGERLDDLQRGGLRILQRPDGFRFGTDAVLLADFAGVKRGEHVADMGTGTGVLPLLLSARAEGTTFDAFELQPQVADMAARSVAINGLEGRIRVHQADCRDAAQRIGHECCQLVVTNPPYTRGGAGLVSPEETRALSRSDSDCTLEEWMAACVSSIRPSDLSMSRSTSISLSRSMKRYSSSASTCLTKALSIMPTASEMRWRTSRAFGVLAVFSSRARASSRRSVVGR